MRTGTSHRMVKNKVFKASMIPKKIEEHNVLHGGSNMLYSIHTVDI